MVGGLILSFARLSHPTDLAESAQLEGSTPKLNTCHLSFAFSSGWCLTLSQLTFNLYPSEQTAQHQLRTITWWQWACLLRWAAKNGLFNHCSNLLKSQFFTHPTKVKWAGKDSDTFKIITTPYLRPPGQLSVSWQNCPWSYCNAKRLPTNQTMGLSDNAPFVWWRHDAFQSSDFTSAWTNNALST